MLANATHKGGPPNLHAYAPKIQSPKFLQRQYVQSCLIGIRHSTSRLRSVIRHNQVPPNLVKPQSRTQSHPKAAQRRPRHPNRTPISTMLARVGPTWLRRMPIRRPQLGQGTPNQHPKPFKGTSIRHPKPSKGTPKATQAPQPHSDFNHVGEGGPNMVETRARDAPQI